MVLLNPPSPPHPLGLMNHSSHEKPIFKASIDSNGKRIVTVCNKTDTTYPTVPCGSNCKTCPAVLQCQTIKSTVTNKEFQCATPSFNCKTTNIVYLITCTRCKSQYVGETKQSLNVRFRQHYTAACRGENSLIYQHYNSANHSPNDMKVQVLETVSESDEKLARHARILAEDFWIRLLNTANPFGLNVKIYGYGNFLIRIYCYKA